MRAVNLLPRDEGGQSRISKQNLPVVVGGIVGVVLAAFVGTQYLSQRGNVAEARSNVADLQLTLSSLPEAPAGPTPQEQQLVGEQDARLTALKAALQNRVAWDRVLRRFSLVLPNDVWLTDLSLKAPVSSSAITPPAEVSGAPAELPTGFTITGSTYSHDGVARLLARMSVLPDLDNVQLVSSSLSPAADGRSVVQFSIAAAIAPPTENQS
jgi:Tfp pilus assembly protein PilN